MKRAAAYEKLRHLIEELDHYIRDGRPKSPRELAARHEARLLREKLLSRVQSFEVVWH